MRARIRLFGLIDQNASESWLDTCGWLISRRGPDSRDYGAAKLLKRMLACGLSPYDPTPLESIERAKQNRKPVRV